MYLVVHALKNILRNKGRYLLIGAVLIICLVSVTVSSMIHFSTEAVIDVQGAKPFHQNLYGHTSKSILYLHHE